MLKNICFIALASVMAQTAALANDVAEQPDPTIQICPIDVQWKDHMVCSPKKGLLRTTRVVIQKDEMSQSYIAFVKNALTGKRGESVDVKLETVIHEGGDSGTTSFEGQGFSLSITPTIWDKPGKPTPGTATFVDLKGKTVTEEVGCRGVRN